MSTSASPEFFRPASSFSAPGPLLVAVTDATAAARAVGLGGADQDQVDRDGPRCCETPTGAGISYLQAPDTCPPAPRKPPPPPPVAACKKRLFGDMEALISLRFDDLDRLFRPSPKCDDKRRRRARSSF